MRALLEEMIARHTGRHEDQMRSDIERDKILTATEAVEYGLVDEVIQTRKCRPLLRTVTGRKSVGQAAPTGRSSGRGRR